jgi:uncharacterized protein YyaL (SSP411 family)
MTTSTLNALSRASSSYLRSAMHQPVQWNEWGEEAFAIARRENKPILLDIGAVWCHWCHVMDRESYDDPEIAQIINDRFVPIKVDRDERPDIDSRYQVAISSISGQGGWPLTGFLTPEGKPFYGGTYFPPDDHYGRPSFKRVLLAISNAFREKNDDVTEQAKMVEGAIAHSESHAAKQGEFSSEIVDAIVKSALQGFDSVHGGFGSAPKFPHPSIIDLLIDQYSRSHDEQLKHVFTTTLEKMALGGVYDQLAGGFHRYSVDERWVVPHFEKMSYDNSELLKNYIHAYQATGSEFFANVSRDIIRWIDEWLTDRERGGFYASQDADYSMEDDGDYFTWTLAEARAVLTEEEEHVAAPYYDINEIGEMHHNPAKNVLYVRASLDEIAERTKFSIEQVKDLLDSAEQKMLAARLNRPTPYIDKTVYVAWNAMFISAYLEAAKVLELGSIRRFALRSLDRLLAEGWSKQNHLLHVLAYSDAAAEHRALPGVLDDYASSVVACLDAYEATSDITYFNFAQKIADRMIGLFCDEDSGGFFDTENTHKDKNHLGVLNVPRKPFQDSPTPAGNAVAAIALTRLHAYTDDKSYLAKARRTIESFSGAAPQYGMFAATYALAGVQLLFPHTQIVIVGEDKNADDLLRAATRGFSTTRAVLQLTPSQAAAPNLPPALAQTIPNLPEIRAPKSLAILCTGMTCEKPITEPEELRRRLEK